MKFSVPLRAGQHHVFDESLFKKAEARRFKKELASRMVAKMEALALDVKQSAKHADCTQADIKRLRKSEIEGYSLEDLVLLARKFDLHISLQIQNPAQPERSLH